MLAIVLCVALACPAFAADQSVPSVSYKDGPAIITAIDANNGDAKGCIIVTTIAQAVDKNTSISEEIRKILLDTYDGLLQGTIEVPYEVNKFVIRELVDIRFDKEFCESVGHEHLPMTVDFELGVDKDALVQVYTYRNEKIEPIKSVENNGDGTVTCVFEQLCPVLFVVGRTDANGNPNTGDNSMIKLCIAMLVISMGVIILLIAKASRKNCNSDK